MTSTYNIAGLKCLCSKYPDSSRITYVLYPMDDLLDNWIEGAAERYETSICVITGMNWDGDLTPWPAPAVPAGSAPFLGNAARFLKTLQTEVLPQIESELEITLPPERNLVGVSLSGLFTLWQWLQCSTFQSIACLSGSFWYEGFDQWVHATPIPLKTGHAFFLLGDREAQSPVKAFQSVATNTADIIGYLRAHGIDATFQSVPGNHYANPIPRLNDAFQSLLVPITA